MPDHATELQRRAIGVVSIALLLFGCQNLTGLNELAADGKQHPDGGLGDAEAGRDASRPGSKDAAAGDDASPPGDASSMDAQEPPPPMDASTPEPEKDDDGPPPDPRPAGRKPVPPAGMDAPPPAGKNAPSAGTNAPPSAGTSAPPPAGKPAPPPAGTNAPPPAGKPAPPPDPQPCNPMDSRYDDDRFDACTAGRACVIDWSGDAPRSECAIIERKPEGTPGASCSVEDECADGNFCSLAHGCVDICLIGLSGCPDKQACIGLADPLVVAGSEFGYCACPGVTSGFCSPLTQCGCSGGQKCDWIDGAATCMSAGTGWLGAACGSPADCATGTSCESGTCHYLCDVNQANACAPGRCQAPGVCKGGFSGSCQNIHFATPTLIADCRKADQMTWAMGSSLDLNFWVSNDNGVLILRPNGGFANSCPEHTVTVEGSRVTLNANCPNSEGVFSQVSLELADKIANIDGALVPN